jgi:hypothetical protein
MSILCQFAITYPALRCGVVNIMPKMKKGYVLTLDAVLALMFVIALLLYTVGVGMKNTIGNTEKTDFKRLHFISEDALEVLNKKGVLDEIGTEWANAGSDKVDTNVHWSNATNMTRDYLSQIIPDRMGYKLMIGDDMIYNHTIPTNETDASVETRSARILTGYASGKLVVGYVSRASLSSIQSARNTILAGWQRTVTPGNKSNHLNLTSQFTLPADFKCNSVHLQAVPRSVPRENFSVWINGNRLTNGTNGRGDTGYQFSTYSGELDCNYFLKRGTNTMKFEVYDTTEVSGLYEIGKGSGTRMIVDYNTSQLGYNVTSRFYLDGAESACKMLQQVTLLMPGTINNISMHLEGRTEKTVQLGIVYDGIIYNLTDYPLSGDFVQNIDNASISTLLYDTLHSHGYKDYTSLENQSFSFLFFFDTNSTSYLTTNKTPNCETLGRRYISNNSYIDVDYMPFPQRTDLYGYNMISEQMNFSAEGEECIAKGYTKNMKANFTLPPKALPWTVDTWLAWMYSSGSPGDLEESMYSNTRELIYLHPPDLLLTRYGFAGGLLQGGAAVVGAVNNFSANGTYLGVATDQLCFNKSLSGGTNTFLYRAFVDYGAPFKYSDGCKFNVTFEDGTYINITMNNTLQECGEDTDDSATDAMRRLVAELNSDNDPMNRSNIKFSADQLTLENTVQGRIRSMWGPAMFKLVIWV